MVVAFAGTHIPLLTLLVYFVSVATVEPAARLQILGISLVATLMGTAATLLALHSLLSPVGATARALKNYWSQKQLPNLPTEYTDDAGILMANTTQIVKQLDEVIRQLKDYDDLTGLPNRRVFKSQLSRALALARASQKIVVFVLDIDGFKNLNAVESSETGDRILSAIAQRLSEQLNQQLNQPLNQQKALPNLARLGNDEFAFFITYKDAPDTSFLVAREILRAISQPYLDISAKLRITASMGIATYPNDGADTDRLIVNAYTALQQAKQKGNHYQFHSAELATALQQRLRLANDLSSALQKNQLLLHYQPRIDWRKNRAVGVECLVRWQHPELGMVSPAEFIPIAEETGLIVPIGEWILRTACAQNKAWQQAGLPALTVAVNLSARQIEQPGLAELVQQVLTETELSPQFLELEVTESLLMGDIDHILVILERLHNQGIMLALDDFGTGYSSLSYLRKFPFDILKIDQSFVRDMVHSADAAEVIRAIVALAKGLRLGLIAEGIETEEQLNQMKTYDCYEIQGYYFSRPLPADKITPLLQDSNLWLGEYSSELGSPATH